MQKEEGIVKIPSHHSVDETVDKLKTILKSKGVTLFAVVDHSGEAEKVGMKMPPTKLLIFGSPKAGTPLMLAAPSAAIDLPLKILVAEDAQGKVWISYNSPEYLKERHGLPRTIPAEYRRRAGAGGCGWRVGPRRSSLRFRSFAASFHGADRRGLANHGPLALRLSAKALWRIATRAGGR